MQEVELRFQVPAKERRGVEADVATSTAQRTRLQALYFDTADRRLAAAGLTLRLRKEGRRWVQTLKAAGPHAMQRFEHNVVLAGQRSGANGGSLRPDPALHAGTDGGQRLLEALSARGGEAEPTLQVQYRTDIQRCHRVLRVPGGSVELAFDRGAITAGAQRLPVCELEIELLHGAPRIVIDVARRWVTRHGLWLEVRSKAERGERLARAGAPPPVQTPVHKASALRLDRDVPVDGALRTIAAHCLDNIMPNTSEIASGEYADEHVHQLRIGLRQLRSALRFVEAWTSLIDPAWQTSLGDVFKQLGATRDRDVLAAAVMPALRNAGAPWVELPPMAATDDPVVSVRASGFTKTLLGLLALSMPVERATASAEQAPALRAHAAQRLEAWHRQVRHDAKRFADLDEAARHRLRRRVKRLRYAAGFVASLYEAKAVARYLKALEPVQESLGRANDANVALALYRDRVDDEPRAWFAVGWLSAQRDSQWAGSATELKAYRRVKPFWRGGR